MKKSIALLLAMVMVLSLIAITGCAAKTPQAAPAQDSAPAEAPAGAAAEPAEAPAEVYTLSVAITQPAEAYAAKLVAEYCAKMEEASSGALKFDIYYSGTLVPVTDVITSVSDGFADIGFIPSNVGMDYFPISAKLLSAPFMGYPSTAAANKAYTTIRAEFPELDAEYEDDGIKNLGAYFMGRNDLYFPAEANVKTPEDLKGMKIGVSSAYMTNYLKAIGATPVFVTNADLYTSLDSGVISGVVQHIALLKSTSSTDLVKSGTFIGDYGMLRDLGIFAMNLDRFNSMPAELQAVLSQGFTDLCEATWNKDEEMRGVFVKGIEESGAKLTTLTEEEAAVWMNAAQSIHAELITELTAQGVPAQAIYDRVAALNAE